MPLNQILTSRIHYSRQPLLKQEALLSQRNRTTC